MDGQILPYALDATASLLSRPRARRATVDEVWDAFRAKVASPYDVTDMLLLAREGLAELLPAEGYYAYVAPAPGAPLRLRLTRAETGTPQIGINYEGLVAGAPVRQAPLELGPGRTGLICQEDGPAGRQVAAIEAELGDGESALTHYASAWLLSKVHSA